VGRLARAIEHHHLKHETKEYEQQLHAWQLLDARYEALLNEARGRAGSVSDPNVALHRGERLLFKVLYS
jgi:hypothetical protein